MKAAKIMALLSILAAIPATTIWLRMDKLGERQNQNVRTPHVRGPISLAHMTSR